MMVKIDCVDQQGKAAGSVSLNEAIFAVEPNPELLAQYVRVYLANQRQGTSATKTRRQVSGGGKKPWRQKGTGRARHGSIRSPIWVGGGIAHGPQPKDWSLKMPLKMRRRALFSALSQKVSRKKVLAIKNWPLPKPQTKIVADFLGQLAWTGKVLIVTAAKEEKLLLSSANLPRVRVRRAQDLNAYEVLDCAQLLLVGEAAEVLEKTFLASAGR